ncbi:hypothetical protein K435DRAFT_965066 [Dendrothele bispora CBS 962.96]|uniref:Uncharacterized protein n=1 Tax=Dendrothele bispora (strain CBS 962.96) TaxID=1314807 RepID=A0A4S8M769_DENBC|nr:hypothetical protein K435DRAFT_965066 [Dendrothele bispora CBS 962.96]
MGSLWDGHVTEYELESVETQSTTILLTAFAILISAMVQAKTLGISSFHTNIVLSLSWMNNTNTFIYFLLYVQHKSQPGQEQVKPECSAWLKHLKGKLSLRSALAQIWDLFWPKGQGIVEKDPEKQEQERKIPVFLFYMRPSPVMIYSSGTPRHDAFAFFH